MTHEPETKHLLRSLPQLLSFVTIVSFRARTLRQHEQSFNDPRKCQCRFKRLPIVKQNRNYVCPWNQFILREHEQNGFWTGTMFPLCACCLSYTRQRFKLDIASQGKNTNLNYVNKHMQTIAFLLTLRLPTHWVLSFQSHCIARLSIPTSLKISDCTSTFIGRMFIFVYVLFSNSSSSLLM